MKNEANGAAEPQHIHEVFTAQTGAEKVGQRRRHQPMVDKELDTAKGLRPQREPGRRLVLIRLIGRITQVFVRYSTPVDLITPAQWF